MGNKDQVRIHRAPWLIPVLAPVLRDGALAISGSRICGLASWRELRSSFPGAEVIDHPETVLLPGLVNGHIHLELSHLDHLSQTGFSGSFPGWINALLAARAESDGQTVQERAAWQTRRQWQSGVAVLADIGNTDLGLHLATIFPGRFFSFLELIGLCEADVRSHIKNLGTRSRERMCTGHAPYSTHASLLLALKNRARGLGHPFPLHVAESEAETELIVLGRGALRDFLEQRGLWQGSFPCSGIDITGSVQYLQNLGLLDRQTVCVHCVQVTRRDVQLLAATGSGVCICPGSNRFLDVGSAPLPWFLEAGILPGLGTDSLASNPELSLWREMRLVHSEHPGVDPATILAMATLGGARMLGLEALYGSLLPGRQAAVLAMPLRDHIQRQQDLMEYLVAEGNSATPIWLEDEAWPA